MEAACSQKGNLHQCHQSTRWTGDARSGRKLSISHSILGRSRPRLAGSIELSILQRVVYFLYFISETFVATLSEQGNNYIAIESDVVYSQCAGGWTTGRAPEQGGRISHDWCHIPVSGRQNDRNSHTEHRTLITRLFIYYMTTSTVHIVYTHVKIISQGYELWGGIFTSQLVEVCRNLKMRIVRGGTDPPSRPFPHM